MQIAALVITRMITAGFGFFHADQVGGGED
jgi:hypothetical protein